MAVFGSAILCTLNKQVTCLPNYPEINQSTLFEKLIFPVHGPHFFKVVIQKQPIALRLWEDGIRQQGHFCMEWVYSGRFHGGERLWTMYDFFS
jgi:hypothetical protein